MKSIEEIINQEPVFIGDFKSQADVFEQFSDTEYDYDLDEYINKNPNQFEDVNVLFAYYSYENYSGYAWVLYEKNGKLYETHGSHCSCYGLEGQWTEEEVDLKELEHRLIEGTFGREEDWYGEDGEYRNLFAYELKEFLGIGLEKEDFNSMAENILGWLN